MSNGDLLAWQGNAKETQRRLPAWLEAQWAFFSVTALALDRLSREGMCFPLWIVFFQVFSLRITVLNKHA